MPIQNSKKSAVTNSISEKDATHALSNLCSRKEVCTFDALKKLQKWEIDSGTAQRIIDYLKKNKFIDDQRYAEAFVKDKFRFGKWGPYKIEIALKLKKIPEVIIHDTLKTINQSDSNQLVFEQLSKKYKSIDTSNMIEARSKLYRFGMSRGFEFDVIQSSVDRLIGAL